MAGIVSTYTNEAGRLVNVYESGMEKDAETGHFIKGPTDKRITAENASVYVRKRQEKQSRLLRAALTREHNAKMEPKANGSAEVFAESGALLYSEIVLNADAYPRDRLETWEKLGKYAQVLADPRDKAEAPTAGQATDMLTALGELVRLLKEEPRDVIEGKVNE